MGDSVNHGSLSSTNHAENDMANMIDLSSATKPEESAKTETELPVIGDILMERYKISKVYGQGNFGVVFGAWDQKAKTEVALKLAKTEKKCKQLIFEAETLKNLSGNVGIPLFYSSGLHNQLNFLVMECLGEDLLKLFKSNGCKFSLKTLYLLAEQMLSRLETLHVKNYVHRDLKLDNFVIGSGRNVGRVYLIDFGSASSLLDEHGERIEYGTLKRYQPRTESYCSMRAHRAKVLGPRDDLETLGYIFVFMLRGGNLWKVDKMKTDERTKEIYRQKKDLLKDAANCSDIPKDFRELIEYSKKLEFQQMPDYCYLRGLFQKAFVSAGYKRDGQFEWTTSSNKERGE